MSKSTFNKMYDMYSLTSQISILSKLFLESMSAKNTIEVIFELKKIKIVYLSLFYQ